MSKRRRVWVVGEGLVIEVLIGGDVINLRLLHHLHLGIALFRRRGLGPFEGIGRLPNDTIALGPVGGVVFGSAVLLLV